MAQQTQYNEDNIRSLDWKEHIRMRPGMYIGKLGDGSSPGSSMVFGSVAKQGSLVFSR